MLQLKLGVLTNTALQTGTICGEQRSPKKREGTGSVIFGPALLLLLAACGGGGGGGGVSVANPEPADTNETPTDETPTDDARVTVNAGPVDAEGVSHQETANTKIDIVAEALQDVSLSAVYKSGDDGADITLEFVDMQNQLRHSFTITNIDEGELDITVDNKPISIQFGTNNEGFTDDDLSGANNYTSVLDGGEGNDTLTGGAGNDTFRVSFVAGQEETITDFTKGEDKIRINVSDTSAVNDLRSLFRDDDIKYLSTTITDYTGNDKNDTVLRFDRGAEGESDADYILVFEGFADALEYSDFSVF